MSGFTSIFVRCLNRLRLTAFHALDASRLERIEEIAADLYVDLELNGVERPVDEHELDLDRSFTDTVALQEAESTRRYVGKFKISVQVRGLKQDFLAGTQEYRLLSADADLELTEVTGVRQEQPLARARSGIHRAVFLRRHNHWTSFDYSTVQHVLIDLLVQMP
jgi:hypothetical protein